MGMKQDIRAGCTGRCELDVNGPWFRSAQPDLLEYQVLFPADLNAGNVLRMIDEVPLS